MQVTALREQHHIYMPMDGRLCMAVLTHESCAVLAAAIKAVLLADEMLFADEVLPADGESTEQEPEEEPAAPAAKRQRA